MQNKITFGKWETVCLLINIINMQIFVSFPRLIVETGGTAAWIVSIYIFILSIISFWLISKLFQRFPGKDIIDIVQEIGGKAVRILIGLSFSLTGIFFEAITLREFSENIKTITLISSPLSFVMIFLILGAIIPVFFGLEPIVRIHSLGAPIIAVAYLIILLLLFPFMHFENVLPIMGNGFPKVFGEGFLRLSFYFGLTIIFYLPPFIKTFSNFKSAGYISLCLTGFFMTVAALVFTTVMPYPTALESTIPIYDLSRLIYYGRFFQKIEPIFVTIWAFAAYLYFCGGLYFLIHVFKKALNLPYLKPLIIPFSILMYTIAFIPDSFMSAVEIEQSFARTYGFLPLLCPPLILLIIAKIMKKGSVKS